MAEKFAELQGGAVPMINGTVTVEVACRAAGIGWSDVFIVPVYTFQATATTLMATETVPMIVDIYPNT